MYTQGARISPFRYRVYIQYTKRSTTNIGTLRIYDGDGEGLVKKSFYFTLEFHIYFAFIYLFRVSVGIKLAPPEYATNAFNSK